jgi:hypothetical protein
VVGSRDIRLVLASLRHDGATEAFAEGRTPTRAARLPAGRSPDLFL